VHMQCVYVGIRGLSIATFTINNDHVTTDGVLWSTRNSIHQDDQTQWHV